MLYVSIFVELLRSRPSLAVWLAALTQALLWLLVPALFYAGPPDHRAEFIKRMEGWWLQRIIHTESAR